MQTDLLKSFFGGDKGPRTPPGIRMHGIYASASTGFSVQFFPESVILGCAPDAARAYPYTVIADGPAPYIRIDAPDHPLHLAFRPDGSLDPGATGAYQVHGRYATGQDENDDFTFAPMEQTCNLAALAPSHGIPLTGAMPATTATAAIHPDSAAYSPYKFAGMACGNKTPDCQKINDAIKAGAISAARADMSGAATLPGVAPGTYYLMISARIGEQTYIWDHPVQLRSGTNSLPLDQRSASPIN